MTENNELDRWTEQIKQDVEGNLIFIYAKGEKNMAMCGFSHRVMEIFNQLGADYNVRNVLPDPIIRQAVSTYTSWPTIPQVFVGGKFIGGCDIVSEMFEAGELKEEIDKAKQAAAAGSNA